ncbi:unnamed protein product, partial [marine sediment metagenome]
AQIGLSPEQWRQAIILAEVLGPPLALREPTSGPTGPPSLTM